MPVTCPHCGARYVLPQSLLGPGGARVRCPKCRETFTVGPAGESIVPLPAPAGSGAAAPAEKAEPAAAAATAEDQPSPREHVATAVAEAPADDDVTASPEPSPPEASAAVATNGDPGAADEPEAAEEIETPAMVARQVLEDLASHSGAAIASSHAEGHLFREFGEVIAEAYDAYRLRVGSDADPAAFRAALRERWGIDLDPGTSPRRLT